MDDMGFGESALEDTANTLNPMHKKSKFNEEQAAAMIQNAWKAKQTKMLGDGSVNIHDHDGDGKIDIDEIAAALVHASRAKKLGELAHLQLLDWYTKSNIAKNTPLLQSFGHVAKLCGWANLNVMLAGMAVGSIFLFLEPYTPLWQATEHELDSRTVIWTWNWIPDIMIWVILDISVALCVVAGITTATKRVVSLIGHVTILFVFMIIPSVFAHWYAKDATVCEGVPEVCNPLSVTRKLMVVRGMSVLANVITVNVYGTIRLWGTGAGGPFVCFIFVTYFFMMGLPPLIVGKVGNGIVQILILNIFLNICNMVTSKLAQCSIERDGTITDVRDWFSSFLLNRMQFAIWTRSIIANSKDIPTEVVTVIFMGLFNVFMRVTWLRQRQLQHKIIQAIKGKPKPDPAAEGKEADEESVEVAGGEEGEEKLATVSELLLQKKFMAQQSVLAECKLFADNWGITAVFVADLVPRMLWPGSHGKHGDKAIWVVFLLWFFQVFVEYMVEVVGTHYSFKQGIDVFKMSLVYRQYNGALYYVQIGMAWFAVCQLINNQTQAKIALAQMDIDEMVRLNQTIYIAAAGPPPPPVGLVQVDH